MDHILWIFCLLLIEIEFKAILSKVEIPMVLSRLFLTLLSC